MKWIKLSEKAPDIGKRILIEYADGKYRDGEIWAMQEYIGFINGSYKFRCSQHSYLCLSDIDNKIENIYWLEVPERK